jgi:hypothetical protein
MTPTLTEEVSMIYVTLAGQWYDGAGYLAALAPRNLEVEIADGNLYDPELPHSVGRIQIKDGALYCWADAYFVPDAGEIERLTIS